MLLHSIATYLKLQVEPLNNVLRVGASVLLAGDGIDTQFQATGDGRPYFTNVISTTRIQIPNPDNHQKRRHKEAPSRDK